MLKINDFKFDDWINQWAGNWSILTFSYWGDCYTQKPFTKRIDQLIQHSVFIWRKGKSSCYWKTSEKEQFGQKFNHLIRLDKNYINKLYNETRNKADHFNSIIDQFIGKDINIKQYKQFQNLLWDYYIPHMQIKNCADYLEPDLASMYFSKIEMARKYVESVLDRSEEFMIELAKIHQNKSGWDYNLILCCDRLEFENYFVGKADLPHKEILQDRYKACAQLSRNEENKLLTGDKVDKIESIVTAVHLTDNLKGMMVHGGKVTGRVKIILNPRNSQGFREGDVLVTGMTRPDYLPLMKKAAAFITDSGGVLCHAAITARELKKPCIIGTEKATKVLKDGDIIEVDADKGIVRKI